MRIVATIVKPQLHGITRGHLYRRNDIVEMDLEYKVDPEEQGLANPYLSPPLLPWRAGMLLLTEEEASSAATVTTMVRHETGNVYRLHGVGLSD